MPSGIKTFAQYFESKSFGSIHNWYGALQEGAVEKSLDWEEKLMEVDNLMTPTITAPI